MILYSKAVFSELKNKFKKALPTLFLICLILAFGLFLRHHNYLFYPRHGATFDEYAWTWLGINLIKEGVPMSWSPHPIYKNIKEIKYQGAGFLIVNPYLEHPPFFGLVAGVFAITRGAEDMYDVNLHQIRLFALILGILSIMLVFLLSSELFGRKIGIISASIYTVMPTVVIGSRLVQNENFFIPLWLFSLFIIAKFLKTNNPWLRNLAGVICGLLILSKIPWGTATLSIFLILIHGRKYKDILKFLVIVIPIAIIYPIYGFLMDKELFINLWLLQLNRYDLNFDSIYALFMQPYLVDRLFIDGWIYFGWFSLILLISKNTRASFILLSGILTYFLVFLTAIPNEAGHGWYRYPFYPFLAISTAIFLVEYYAKNWVLTFFFIVFLGTSLLASTYYPLYGFSYTIFRISIITWAFPLLPYFMKSRNALLIGKASSYIWLFLILSLSVISSYIYLE